MQHIINADGNEETIAETSIVDIHLEELQKRLEMYMAKFKGMYVSNSSILKMCNLKKNKSMHHIDGRILFLFL